MYDSVILLLRSVFKVRDGTWSVLVRKIGLKFPPKCSPASPATKENETLTLPGAWAQFRLPMQGLKTLRIEFLVSKFGRDF